MLGLGSPVSYYVAAATTELECTLTAKKFCTVGTQEHCMNVQSVVVVFVVVVVVFTQASKSRLKI